MRILTLVGLVALFGCQKGEKAPTAYERDVDRICHAEEHSGAAEHDGPRTLVIAQWLGENIETDEGRELLARVTRDDNDPAAKARILDEAATAAGIDDCPTARTWVPKP
jgi:hypothetical protein